MRTRASGGRGGIRTHGGLAPTPVFKTGALNHSATLPDQYYQYVTDFHFPSKVRIGTEPRAFLLVQEVCDKPLRLISGILLHVGKRVGIPLQSEGHGRIRGRQRHLGTPTEREIGVTIEPIRCALLQRQLRRQSKR